MTPSFYNCRFAKQCKICKNYSITVMLHFHFVIHYAETSQSTKPAMRSINFNPITFFFLNPTYRLPLTCSRPGSHCEGNQTLVLEPHVHWALDYKTWEYIYSSPPLIRTAFLSNNSVKFWKGVLWGEGASHVFMTLAAKKLCPFKRGVLSRECPLKEGELHTQIHTIDL